jgi:hypothetical protein
MRTLRELLTTWETWSARDVVRRATEHAGQPGELDLALAEGPTVMPLDALLDTTELITLLSGWRWQADYAEAVERQERHGFGDVTRYRAAL